MLENKDIVFSGNNYSDQWVVEASKRGLPNLKNTIEALDTLKNAEDTSFLADFNILSTDEITTRYNILLENYVDSNLIEFSTLLEMVHAFVIPSIEKQLIQSYSVMNQAVGADFKKLQEARTKKMEGVMSALLRRHQKLTDIVEALMEDEDISNKSAHIAGKARKAALTLREASDEAETLVADDLWKLPRYREMLFSNVFK
jgi:glutamine synthetase